MELVDKKIQQIEEYDFSKAKEILSDIKNIEKMPHKCHIDAKGDYNGKKCAIEIKQRNQDINEFKKYKTYPLTERKLRHLQDSTKDFDHLWYLILHLGRWSLYDLRAIDWEKIPLRPWTIKAREMDGKSQYTVEDTYFIPYEMAIKSGNYEIGDRPWLSA